MNKPNIIRPFCSFCSARPMPGVRKRPPPNGEGLMGFVLRQAVPVVVSV
jgi:hypothetical protein